MSLLVKYIDAPDGAQQAAQVMCDMGQPFSDPAVVAAGAADAPWATLEPGVWTLDGSRELLPDAPEEVGWWSRERSGEDGRFTNPPVIVIDFPDPYIATGLTFTFWPSTGQWCSEVKVSWYNGETLLDEVITYPDRASWILQRRVDSFDSIRVELRATNFPGQFAKLQQIQIGQTVIFGSDELTKVQLVNEVDPTFCNLPVDTMKIELRDRVGRAFAPQENQRMELYRDGQLLAAQYIVESSREARHYYTFSCQSVIGLLEDEYLGGVYRDKSVEELLDEILDGRAYDLDPVFAGQTVTGYLPICTRREALQQLAFALGALVTTQGGDAVHLRPLPNAITGTFTPERVFSGAKVENAARIARFEVVAHSYLPSAKSTILLDNETLDGGDLFLTFDQPYYDYSVAGGTVIDSGENWIRITAAGAVTLTAKPYVHSTVRYARQNTAATAVERGNVVTVEEATLIHSGNVQSALDRLYSAGQLRQTLSQDAVVDQHYAGEWVSSVNPWGTLTQGILTAMDSALTQNGHTAAVTILGVEVSAENAEEEVASE